MFEWDDEEQRWGAVHHPFTRPTEEWEERFDDDPANALALALRPDRERQRARRRLLPDPRARPAGPRLRPARASAVTSSGRSSASCSTRSAWAPRRTAASPSGSTGCSWCWPARQNLSDTIAFPKNQAGARSDDRRPERRRSAAPERARNPLDRRAGIVTSGQAQAPDGRWRSHTSTEGAPRAYA